MTNLAFTDDSAAPTGDTISYPNGYATGRSLSVTFTTGTDAGSGIASRRLQRATATLTGTTCGTFGAFSDLGSVNPASPYTDSSLAVGCYKYRYVVTDRVGNQDVATSASVVKIGYAAAVDATTGLLSHWRLGEAAQSLISTDAFTDTSGTSLASHSDGFGTIWKHQTGGANAVVTDANRVRRNGVAGYTIDYVDATPTSADYSVEADLVVKSNLASDATGVIGRLNTAATTFYMARWEQAAAGTTGTWRLARYSSGTATSLAALTSQPQPVVGETYRIKLEMIGSSLALYVNGVLKVSATDATITAAGRAGIMDGTDTLSASKGNTTGLHIDDFQVTPSTYARAADSKGSNTGDYKNGVTTSAPGALAAGSNTAATFDGVNDYVQMTGTTGIPVGAAVRSTELWFKTSSAARQVLFRYGSGANTQEYGALDRRRWDDHDRLGPGQRQRQDLHDAERRSTTAPGTRSSRPTTARRSRSTSTALRWPRRRPPARRPWTSTASASGRSSARPTATRAASSGLYRRGVVLHLGPEPGHGHRPLPARHAPAVDLDRPHRWLGRRDRSRGHRVALLHLDDAEPRAGQGHRPERGGDLGQPGCCARRRR